MQTHDLIIYGYLSAGQLSTGKKNSESQVFDWSLKKNVKIQRRGRLGEMDLPQQGSIAQEILLSCFLFPLIFFKKKKETKAGRGKKILAFSYVIRYKYLNVNYFFFLSVVKMEAFHFLLHFLKENMTRYCIVFCFPHYKICSYCFIAKIRKNILKKNINELNYVRYQDFRYQNFWLDFQ